MIKLLLIFTLFSLLESSESKKIFRPQNVVPRLFPGRLIWAPDFIDRCKNVTQLIAFGDGFHLTKIGLNTLVNADWELSRTMNTVTKVITRIDNCADATKTSCQLFQTWRFGKEACTLLEAKDQFWTPFFGNVAPAWRCPLGKGKYLMRNATVDVDKLLLHPIPLEKYYWRVKFESFAPELLCCLEAGGRFMRARTRK